MKKIIAWLWARRKVKSRQATLSELEAYLRLFHYMQELVNSYKEAVMFVMDKLKGRKEYWEGQAAGLRVKALDKDITTELRVAQASINELALFLDWLETAFNKVNNEVKKISDKFQEEIRHLPP